jgi:NADPH:quinone reductase-like Zn-dependent oxidoreductase
VVGRAAHAAACRVDERIEVVVGEGDVLVSALDGRCPALVVDTVGGPTLAAVLAAAPRRGRVAAVGYTRGTDVTLHLPTFLLREVELRPVSGIGRDARNRELAPYLTRLLVHGRVHVSVERYLLTELDAALDRLASGDAVGRVVVEPGTP